MTHGGNSFLLVSPLVHFPLPLYSPWWSSIYEYSICIYIHRRICNPDNTVRPHPRNGLHLTHEPSKSTKTPGQHSLCQQNHIPCSRVRMHLLPNLEEKCCCMAQLQRFLLSSFTLRHTNIQAGGQRMWIGWAWWKAGIMCLTESLSDLSKAAEKPPGGRHTLTQMTNVHWTLPIPLLSARTNTSHRVCVCVCSDTVPQQHQINDTNGPYLIALLWENGSRHLLWSEKWATRSLKNHFLRIMIKKQTKKKTHRLTSLCLTEHMPMFTLTALKNSLNWKDHSSVPFWV